MKMTPRERFLAALAREQTDRPCVGSATSVATMELMDLLDAPWPEAHTNPEKMATLAAAGHTLFGYDNVMPLFSVMHEAAALGAPVDWGEKDLMPVIPADTNPYLYLPAFLRPDSGEDFVTPKAADFYEHPSIQTSLKALRLLKEQFGDEVAVVGKVFGPWTLGYHMYGVQGYLTMAIDDPDRTRRAIRNLMEVTVMFAEMQLEVGVDALTLADHSTGDLVSAEYYRDFLLAPHQELSRRIACPVILHCCGQTLDRLPYMAQSGFACFHFDSRNDPALAMEIARGKIALMGGINNPELLMQGKPPDVEPVVRRILDAGVQVAGPE
jgi:[methyl-Co(III) methanol-specific corrinoid protein]:coenzyme M methyltransferase